jgi:hypothetical protein
MNLRPFKTIRQYKQLVEALNTIIGQLKTINAQQEEIITLNGQTIKSQAQVIEAQTATITAMKKESSEPLKIPLPDVGAVEGLVSAFFENESVTVARNAFELTKGYTPLAPDDVRATQRTLLKLWRTYSWRKLEQAEKQT